MVLVIKAKAADLPKVEGFLQKMCPAASIDKKTGRVSVAQGPYAAAYNRACCCLNNLARRNDRTVKIVPLANTAAIVPGTKVTLRRMGPAITGAGPGKNKKKVKGKTVNGAGANSDLYSDLSDNNGKGYYVHDQNGRKIDMPMEVILYHELCQGHATHNADGSRDPNNPEDQAIRSENEFRKDQGRSERKGRRGGLNTGPRPPK